MEVRGALGDHDTLPSIAKAQPILGFEPPHTWRAEAAKTAM